MVNERVSGGVVVSEWTVAFCCDGELLVELMVCLYRCVYELTMNVNWNCFLAVCELVMVSRYIQ